MCKSFVVDSITQWFSKFFPERFSIQNTAGETNYSSIPLDLPMSSLKLRKVNKPFEAFQSITAIKWKIPIICPRLYPVHPLQRRPRRWSTAGLCQPKGWLAGFSTPSSKSTDARANPGRNQTGRDCGKTVQHWSHPLCTQTPPSLDPEASQVRYRNLLSSSHSPQQEGPELS